MLVYNNNSYRKIIYKCNKEIFYTGTFVFPMQMFLGYWLTSVEMQFYQDLRRNS